jgi:hypothetical protein
VGNVVAHHRALARDLTYACHCTLQFMSTQSGPPAATKLGIIEAAVQPRPA